MFISFIKDRILFLFSIACFIVTSIYITNFQQQTQIEKKFVRDVEASFHVDEILPSTMFRQALPAVKNVTGITVGFATFARCNKGIFKVCIKDDESNTILYSEDLRMEDVQDNVARTFRFPRPIVFSHRTALYLQGGEGCCPGNAITCWGIGRDVQGLTKNGQPINGNLNYSIFVNEKNDCTYLLCFWGVLAFLLFILKDQFLLKCVQNPARLFLFISLASALAICYFTPPVYVMDAHYHLMRVYQVSKGYFLHRSEDVATSAEKRWSDAVLAQHLLPRTSAVTIASKTGPIDEVDFDCGSLVQRHGADCYTPFAYAYAAVSATIARLLRLNLADGILLISFTCIFAYIGVIYLILLKVEYYRWQIFLLALSPQVIWQGITYSADAFCLLCSFALFAAIVNMRCQKVAYTKLQLVLLATLAIVSCQCKFVYLPLLAMLLFLPARSFSNRNKYRGYISIVFTLSIVFGLLWWKVSAVQDGSVDGQTLASKVNFVVRHPLDYAKLWLIHCYDRSIWKALSITLSYKIFLWTDYHLYFQAFFFSSFLLLREKTWNLSSRFVAFLVFWICVGLIDTAMYVYFSNGFGGAQGRYFAPLLPLFCIMFGQGRWGLPEKYASYYKGILVIFAILTQVVVVETSRQGYWL